MVPTESTLIDDHIQESTTLINGYHYRLREDLPELRYIYFCILTVILVIIIAYTKFKQSCQFTARKLQTFGSS